MKNNLNNLYIDVKKLNDIFNEALIVIDTNVLLMAYQWRDTTFNQVFEILDELSKEERLIIPAQVLKEFANKRPQTIRDLLNDIHNKILSKLDRGKADHHSLDKVIPSLEFMHNKDKLLESEKKYNEALLSLKEAQKEYKSTLNELLDNIKEYLDNDPITERFKGIFEKSCLEDLNLKEDWLKSELERRKKHSIPPGYRDKGHMGDMIIWSEILKLNEKHVIFITRDNKNDWVYKDSAGNVMGARRELVEEFYTANEKSFKIMTPLKFLETYLKHKGESVNDTVRDDMEKEEIEFNSLLKSIYSKKVNPRFDFYKFDDTMSNNLKQLLLNVYEKRIDEKLDLVGREGIVTPEEYDLLYEEYDEAKDFIISDPDKAKKIFDIIDNKLGYVLEDVFGS